MRPKCLFEWKRVALVFLKEKKFHTQYLEKNDLSLCWLTWQLFFHHMNEIKHSFQAHYGFYFKIKNCELSRIRSWLERPEQRLTSFPNFEMLEKVLYPEMAINFSKKRNLWTPRNYWGLLQKLLKLNHRSITLFFLI